MRHPLVYRLALLGLSFIPVACGRTDAPPEVKTEPPKASPMPAPARAMGGDTPLHHPERAIDKAPDQFKVKFTTTKGDFVVEVTRAWAPNGADRFYNLVKLGFYDGTRFFRAVDGFMVQWGIHGEPSVSGVWYRAAIPDDPVVKGNKRGFVTFATAGKNLRTTQIFINYSDGNARLDGMGFAAFGEVTSGMPVVDSLFKGYGEGAPQGKGPDQSRIQREGNPYLEKEFPELDAIKDAKIL